MPKIISFHSFRRGTGKSNIIANIASLLAKQGMRVGVIDTDVQSPSAHILYNLEAKQINKTWTDFLWGEASVEDIVSVRDVIGVGPSSRLIVEGSEKTKAVPFAKDGIRSIVNPKSLDSVLPHSVPS